MTTMARMDDDDDDDDGWMGRRGWVDIVER